MTDKRVSAGSTTAGPAAVGTRAPARLKVLIVEDDPDASDTMARVLASRGWGAARARSAVDALRMARRESFDLALVDISLGGELDGIDVAEWLSRLYDLPIVFATSST